MKALLPFLCAISIVAGMPAHATSTKAGEHQAQEKRGQRKPLTTEVRFFIGRNGDLLSASVSRSSGNRKVDAEAIAAVRRAAPFPKRPAGTPARMEMRIKLQMDPDAAARLGK
ncbi:energy transducer TonB [Ensifer sp.]|uniref:energy transducer TonB n=1 Tax=Ensifer sp. TaxID=1872086 RepID=UPI0028978209|nr:energy transducer TonB [Ensifer sp.]